MFSKFPVSLNYFNQQVHFLRTLYIIYVLYDALWPLGILSKITCLCLLWNEFHVIDHVFYQVEK